MDPPGPRRPPAVYTYLRGGPERPSAEVAEAHYDPAELRARVVVRDEVRQKFAIFETWADFWSWQDGRAEEERCFHEVIFGDAPQRLKFDIDAPGAKIDALEWEPEGGLGEEGPETHAYLELLLGEPVAAPRAPTEAAQALGRQRRKAEAFLEHFLEVLLEELHVAYHGADDLRATRRDLIVADSTGPSGGGVKYSYHVLVAPYVVASNEEAKGFTARVLERLAPPLRGLVDPQVNKSLQNFRLAGSSKPGSGRVKRLTTRFGTAPAAPPGAVVRGEPGARVLARLYTEETDGGGARLREGGDPRAREPPLAEGAVAEALEAARAAGLLEAHAFQRAEGGLLLFRRTAPGPCRICGRDHDRDNTLMLSLVPQDEGGGGAKAPHTLLEHCRHAPRGSARAVGVVEAPRREPFAPPAGGRRAKGRPGLTAEARVAALAAGQIDPHAAAASGFEGLPAAQRHVYSEPRMRPYEAVPTLAVKAQTKMGKSRALRAYIDREYPRAPGGAREPVIRFATFRQTFSKTAQQAFPDFALYSDHGGDLDHLRFPRLIVQVESLHRLPMPEAPEPVDLLVLDEVESILAQFNSGLHRNFTASFAMFQWMVATADRVVVMDANLGDRTLRLLERLRGGRPPLFHWNQHPQAAGDRFYFAGEQGVWLDHLYERLRGGQRAVVATNSLAEAEALEAGIRARFPEKAVGLYSSKTPQGVKAAHFGDLHTHWTALDVLIYTPTVSAGVSYELEHFDVLFGHFTDASCDVETCRQMLARVRSLSTREHFIHLSGRACNLPTEVADLRRLLRDKRSGLYRRLDAVGGAPAVGLQFEYGPGGEVRFHETPYYDLWLETARVANLSRNGFVARFIDQIADTGATLAALEPLPDAGGRLVGLRAGHKRVRLELAEAENRALAAAPEIAPEEAAAVRDLLDRQAEVAPERRQEYLRWKLADAYRWHGRPIDGAFVAAYNTPQAVRVFRNLRRIAAGPTLVDSLREIQLQEAVCHRAFMDPAAFRHAAGGASAAESRDLHQRYVFQSHFLAVWLIHLAGFRCLTDPARLHEGELYHRFLVGRPALAERLEMISYEFEIPRANARALWAETGEAQLVRRGLGVVNPVLRAMYGREVRRAPGREGKLFALSPTKLGELFAFGPDPVFGGPPPGDRPNVPSQLECQGRDVDDLSLLLDEYFYERGEGADSD
jgi:hypothetical protein